VCSRKLESNVNRKAKDTAGTSQRGSDELELAPSLTVKQLADKLNVEPAKAIKQLMRHGVMVSINQVIDFDTAAKIAQDLGYNVRQQTERHVQPSRAGRSKGKLKPRPPVVTVMGHVDHGKTTLLDSIRKTNVTAREAGAITQHTGAYQAVVDGRRITFLDTPGHKAFTAMRARGAQATDIVILVVAADDGVMPQTIEAISHAKAAGVSMVVAINKIDKPDANIDRVKQQLADAGLVIEEWGGDTVCVPISAKEGKGIPDLLENLFLVADILELKADPNCPAAGVVIEAKLDKTKGVLGTLLVQKGMLEIGQTVVAGHAWGKVKAMFDDNGTRVEKAEPSTPVGILGLNAVPEAGELFAAVADEHRARSTAETHQASRARAPLSLGALSNQIGTGQLRELNIVLKTDVQGSIEPIRSCIEQLNNDKARANIIHASSGSVTESDVLLASASEGIVIGFNTSPAPGAQQLADAEGVSIQHYDVIYRLEEDMDRALKGMLQPTYADVIGGRAEVRAIFSSSKRSKVAGVYVKEGKMWRDATAKVLRQNEVVHESHVSGLRRFKNDVAEVAAGLECGVGIEGFGDFQVGDIIELYRREKVT
jgi:translation initiation factor IF-2